MILTDLTYGFVGGIAVIVTGRAIIEGLWGNKKKNGDKPVHCSIEGSCSEHIQDANKNKGEYLHATNVIDRMERKSIETATKTNVLLKQILIVLLMVLKLIVINIVII